LTAVVYLTYWTLGCADAGTEGLALGSREIGLVVVDNILRHDYTLDAVYKGALGLDTVAHYCTSSREPGHPQSSDMVAWLPGIGSLPVIMGLDHRGSMGLDTKVDFQYVDMVLVCNIGPVWVGEDAVVVLGAVLASATT